METISTQSPRANPMRTTRPPARSVARAHRLLAARVPPAARGAEASAARSCRRTSLTRRSGTIADGRAAGAQVGTMGDDIRDRARGITVARLFPLTKHTPTLFRVVSYN